MPLVVARRSAKPQHPARQGRIAPTVEGVIGDADDVVGDEAGALASPVLGVLQRAFPFEHCPTRKTVLRELREDRLEVDLPVAERAEAPGALDPRREARINALPPARPELGVLDVEGADALVVDVGEGETIELLQQEMRGIVVDPAALMAAEPVEEKLKSRAVEDILAGMDLEADIDAMLLLDIEDRPTARLRIRP